MPLDLCNPGRTIHAGVILTHGSTTELIDVAPFEFFAWINKNGVETLGLPEHMRNEALDIELHWVTQDGEPARMKSQAKLQPTDSFKTCPPLDIVLMGAHNFSYRCNDTEKAFIRTSFEQCTAFLTVCGGIATLLDAGLLEGRTASAPRMAVGSLRKIAPTTTWLDRRWTHDDKLWSSSSLVNGFDLMRAFAEHVWGGRSGMVEGALDAGHFPERDVDFRDFKGHHYPIDMP